MTEGKKTAKVEAARFIESKNGTLAIEVAFQTNEGRIVWQGWLSPAAAERTMETLVDVLGFNGDDEVDPVTCYLKSSALDSNRDVELDIRMETYEGKTRPKVAWVNKPGGGSGFKKLTPEVVKGTLNAIGFKNMYLAKKAGKPPSNEKLPF